MRKFAALLILMGACSPDSPPPSSPAAEPADPDRVSFQVPSGWVKESPTNRLRKAQYRVPDKEKKEKDALCTVSHFSAIVTKVEDNINRWRHQMGGAEAATEAIDGKCKATLADLCGTYTDEFAGETIAGARMLAAVVETQDGPWYFKLVGPAETVGDWRDEFVALLKGVTP